MASVSDFANVGIQDRAELAALELIRRAVADLPQAIVRNMTDADRIRRHEPEQPRAGAPDIRDPLAAGGGGGTSGTTATGARSQQNNPFALVTRQFALMLGPLAILNQTLNTQTSGFQVLGKVVGLVATMFSAFLLPIIIQIAGALLEWSDSVEGDFLKSAKDFAEYIHDYVVPAMKLLAEFVGGVMIAKLAQMAFSIDGLIGGIGVAVAYFATLKPEELKEVGEDLFDIASGLAGAPTGIVKRGVEREEKKAAEAGTVKSREEESIAARIAATEDVIASLKMSLTPRAQFSQLAQVGQNVQLAALNADPIEQRILRLQQKLVDLVEELKNAAMGLKGTDRVVYGTGDFAPDTGAGGGFEGGDF